MQYQIITSRQVFTGKFPARLLEEEFPKIFESKEEAEKFGKRFFEPPQTVLKWRVEAIPT